MTTALETPSSVQYPPLVDVVIPIHTPQRPIERAVSSVVGDNPYTRAIVVVHNMPADPIRERLAGYGERVWILDLQDGIPSPAGPLNHGLEHATATWVTCMGSDDFYQPGSGAAWFHHLHQRNPDVLIVPSIDEDEPGVLDIPPVRPGRTRNLHVIHDRLLYRTGPLFLVRRSLLQQYGIRMTPGLRTGEDLAYSCGVWLHARRIDLLPPGSPAYVVASDGGPRVTQAPFSLGEMVKPAAALLHEPWLPDVDQRRSDALTIRILRRTILPAVIAHRENLRRHPGSMVSDYEAVSHTARQWCAISPYAVLSLSVTEERLLAALITQQGPAALAYSCDAMTQGPRWQKVLPRRLVGWPTPDTRLAHMGARTLRDPRWRETGPEPMRAHLRRGRVRRPRITRPRVGRPIITRPQILKGRRTRRP